MEGAFPIIESSIFLDEDDPNNQLNGVRNLLKIKVIIEDLREENLQSKDGEIFKVFPCSKQNNTDE